MGWDSIISNPTQSDLAYKSSRLLGQQKNIYPTLLQSNLTDLKTWTMWNKPRSPFLSFIICFGKFLSKIYRLFYKKYFINLYIKLKKFYLDWNVDIPLIFFLNLQWFCALVSIVKPLTIKGLLNAWPKLCTQPHLIPIWMNYFGVKVMFDPQPVSNGLLRPGFSIDLMQPNQSMH